MGIITMIIHKQKILAALVALTSIIATAQAMQDNLSIEKALLSKRPFAQIMSIAENSRVQHELRIYALETLVYQERDFELQARARLMLAGCYRTGALHRRLSMNTALELVEPINSMPVSAEIKKQAQEELAMLKILSLK